MMKHTNNFSFYSRFQTELRFKLGQIKTVLLSEVKFDNYIQNFIISYVIFHFSIKIVRAFQ